MKHLSVFFALAASLSLTAHANEDGVGESETEFFVDAGFSYSHRLDRFKFDNAEFPGVNITRSTPGVRAAVGFRSDQYDSDRDDYEVLLELRSSIPGLTEIESAVRNSDGSTDRFSTDSYTYGLGIRGDRDWHGDLVDPTDSGFRPLSTLVNLNGGFDFQQTHFDDDRDGQKDQSTFDIGLTSHPFAVVGPEGSFDLGIPVLLAARVGARGDVGFAFRGGDDPLPGVGDADFDFSDDTSVRSEGWDNHLAFAPMALIDLELGEQAKPGFTQFRVSGVHTPEELAFDGRNSPAIEVYIDGRIRLTEISGEPVSLNLRGFYLDGQVNRTGGPEGAYDSVSTLQDSTVWGATAGPSIPLDVSFD